MKRADPVETTILKDRAHQPLRIDEPPHICYAGEGIHGGTQRRASYCLKQAWCLHLYHYVGRIQIGDWQGDIRPGALSLVSPGVRLSHEWMRPESRHLFVHFEISAKSTAQVPSARNWFPTVSEPIKTLLCVAVDAFPHSPHRARCALWEALHQLGEMSSNSPEFAHPAERILAEIHRRVGQPIDLQTIAEAVHLSPNHCNQLLRDRVGLTICAYWRRLKIERARHLLLESDLPVKAIAADLGYTDLQQFNKLLRLHSGCSPRNLRKS